MTPVSLQVHLREIGVPPQRGRTSAIRQLVLQAPAPVIAWRLFMAQMTDNAGMTRPRIRVTAYVIRNRAVPEVLVFDHTGMPEAGTQVPAGGVKSGEDLEEAVLREVAEETGLLTATVVRQIAVESKPHPDTGQPRRTTFFHLQAPAETRDAWNHHVKGDGDDAGLIFTCRFLPLPLEQPLADDQDSWLGHIDPRWTTASGDSQ